MIDFTIVGTKVIGDLSEIEYRCTLWEGENTIGIYRDNLVTHGQKYWENELYILLERENYKGCNYYMIKLSDLNKKFNNIEQINYEIY